MYLEVKTFHLATVAISISLFIFRFLRYYAYAKIKPQPPLLKYFPHLNDTLLFSSGIALISITKFVPFSGVAPWLSYKLAAVLLYIVCGFWAMNKKASQWSRIFFFLASIGWLLVVIALAISKQVTTIL